MITPAVPSFLDSLKPGPVQSAGRLRVVPLMGGAPPAEPDYLALIDALEQQLVEVTEVSQGGSVPELCLVNDSDRPVLLLDGEELAGAKQNRVLNTTILVAARSKTRVPVSCSEHGRWQYVSPSFKSSGHVLSAVARRKKSSSVSSSLFHLGAFHSNQGEVWNEIDMLHAKLGTGEFSPTGAMSDAFATFQKNLDELSAAFPAVEGQVGLLVFLDGSIAGCDAISRPEVYPKLHDRLVRSYAVESLDHEVDPADPAGAPLADDPDAAAAFLARARASDSAAHPSPGLGEDHRITGAQLAGSALVVDGTLVHLALFPADPAAEARPGSFPATGLRRPHRRL